MSGIAIGYNAGATGQGNNNAIAIGSNAGNHYSTPPTPHPTSTPMMQTNSMGINNDQLINMMMTGYTMKMMNTVSDTSGGTGLSYDKILAVIVLLFSNDIKRLAGEFIEGGKQLVVQLIPKWFTSGWEWVVGMFVWFWTRKMTPAPIAHKESWDCVLYPTQTCMSIQFEQNLFNMNALYKFLTLSDEQRTKLGYNRPLSFTYNNQVVTKIETMDKHYSTFVLENIQFQLGDGDSMQVTLDSQITMEVDHSMGALKGILVKSENNKINWETNEFYTGILIPELKEKARQALSAELDKSDYRTLYNFVFQNTGTLFINFKNAFISQKYETETAMFNYLKDNTQLYNWATHHDYFNIIVFLIMSMVENNPSIVKNQKYMVESFAVLCIITVSIFTPQVSMFNIYIYKSNYELKYILGGYFYKSDKPPLPITNLIFGIGLTNILKYSFNYSLDDLQNMAASANKSITSYIVFNLAYTGAITHKELYDRFYDFYKSVILNAPALAKVADPNMRKSVAVYAIHIETTEEIKTEPNPEYLEWLELFGAGGAGVSTEVGAAAAATPPQQAAPKAMLAAEMRVEAFKMKPPKNLLTKTAKSELICKLINRVHKDVGTLYLKENDKQKMLSVIDKFKNRRDFYDQMGIPYKLGMLFYGAPGTGKTSTIKAIASYLEKDIYFVNLKNVHTNSQLKIIFDHINEKCNGGVIVFEDMDASCEAVKRRVAIGETQAGTMADAMEEEHKDQLTLSYLLNLFDGTICRDGTIFAITTNYLENMDPALYRSGRVDIKIEFHRCDHFQIAQIFQSIIGRPISDAVLERIPEFKYTPADIIFHIYHYMLDDSMSDENIMHAFLGVTPIDSTQN